jgi:predicted type IV restriction endonuclease
MAKKSAKEPTYHDLLKQLGEKVEATKEQVTTEEGTKMSFIQPLIAILGYDMSDPNDVSAEFTADGMNKRGEKVDYALKQKGKASILIECKKWKEKLDKHGIQLYRYFTPVDAKFGILTNGIKYWFFTDIDKTNVMDSTPFFVFDITDHSEEDADFLMQFSKLSFDQKKITEQAMNLAYSRDIRNLLVKEIQAPSRDFIRYIAEKTYLEKQRGKISEKVMAQYVELVKKNTPLILDELFAARLIPKNNKGNEEAGEFEENKIVTTEEELEAFFIVKAICRQKVEASRIVFRDAQTYFAILLDNNRLKTVCRLYLNSSTKKYLALFDKDKNEVKHEIKSVDEIFKYAEKIVEGLSTLKK